MISDITQILYLISQVVELDLKTMVLIGSINRYLRRRVSPKYRLEYQKYKDDKAWKNLAYKYRDCLRCDDSYDCRCYRCHNNDNIPEYITALGSGVVYRNKTLCDFCNYNRLLRVKENDCYMQTIYRDYDDDIYDDDSGDLDDYDECVFQHLKQRFMIEDGECECENSLKFYSFFEESIKSAKEILIEQEKTWCIVDNYELIIYKPIEYIDDEYIDYAEELAIQLESVYCY